MKGNYSPLRVVQIQENVTEFLRLHTARGDGHYYSHRFLGQKFDVHPDDVRRILEPFVADGQLEVLTSSNRMKPVFWGLFYRNVSGDINYRYSQNVKKKGN